MIWESETIRLIPVSKIPQSLGWDFIVSRLEVSQLDLSVM